MVDNKRIKNKHYKELSLKVILQ